MLTVTDSNGVATDTINDFVTGTDKIGVSIGANAGETVSYVGEASSYGTVLTSFTGLYNQAVLDTSTKTLYIDVNGDAALTAADISINLTVSDLSQKDFATFGTTGADAILASAGVDTIYGLGGGDTITVIDNTATIGSVATSSLGVTSLSTTGMDIVYGAVATDTIVLNGIQN